MRNRADPEAPAMRMPRMTIPRAIITAAIVGGLLAVGRKWSSRSAQRRAKAREYAWLAICSGNIHGPEGDRIRQEYGALRHKYERAARYPWLPVAPDPPPPE